MSRESRVCYERLRYIEDRLRDGGNLTRAEVEQKFECSRTTFMRDIEFLRDRIRLNIVWKDNRYQLEEV